MDELLPSLLIVAAAMAALAFGTARRGRSAADDDQGCRHCASPCDADGRKPASLPGKSVR